MTQRHWLALRLAHPENLINTDFEFMSRPIPCRRVKRLAIEMLEVRHLLAASPMISEFMADNKTTLADGDGLFSDWIEIQNTGDLPADLQGWSLTDDPADLVKWPFPDVSLAADAAMVVFASAPGATIPAGGIASGGIASDGIASDGIARDGIARDGIASDYVDPLGYRHTNFKLNADGEYLALVDNTGPTPVIVQQFGSTTTNFPPQYEDVSFGISPGQDETVLVAEGAAALAIVPTDGSLGLDWTGGSEPFADGSWTSGAAGVGYDTSAGLPTTLAGYWPLNGTSGTNADDLTASDGATDEYDGTLSGGAVWTTDAERGQVVTLDGSNDHIAVADADALDPGSGAFSVAAWINVSNAAVRQDIVGKQVGPASNYAGWALRISQSSGSRKLMVFLNADNGFNRIDATGTQILSENEWLHVVMTYDGSGSAGGVSFYINGIKDSLSAASGQLSIPVSTNGNMSIGQNGNGALPFRGMIDDVSVWNTELSADEIALLSGGSLLSSLGGFNTLIGLDLQSQMLGNNASALVRIPFDVEQGVTPDVVTLRMKYDDAFVAYLDGVEIARRNAPPSESWNSTAENDRLMSDAVVFEDIDVSEYATTLTPGPHILAIQGLNNLASSSEFLILPELLSTTDLGLIEGFFATPTPGQANGESFQGYVADTQFSLDRGFYDSPIQVEITSATPEVTIRYTTDGSLPTDSYGTVYTGPIDVDQTTTLRAIATRDDYVSTNVDTQTYIFRSNILTQTRPDGFPTATSDPNVSIDYDVDPRISLDPLYQDRFLDSLVELPSVSIVMDFNDLFDTANGIYPNSTRDGDAWQRPASIEWIDPTGGGEFQIDAGINVSGRSSRTWSNTAKHNFRLKFSSEFGPTKLKFPLFEDSPVDEFDQLVIRNPTQDSWNTGRKEYRENAQYSVDRWFRQTYRDMGHAAGYGRFAHVYLNGLYWGMYEVAERPNSDFAASHLGGEPEQYDALNAGAVKDGNAAAWNLMHQIANGQGTGGSIVNSAAYEQIQEYLDVEALADYVILNVYGANIDWPGNNYWAVRRREPGAQFLFVPWDSEHPLWETQWDASEFGNGSALDYNVLSSSRFPGTRKGAGYLYARLKNNTEFQLLMADRLNKLLASGGVLTPEVAAAQFQTLLDDAGVGLIGESARWGDAHGNSPIDASMPFTPDVDWARASGWLIDEFFPGRTEIVLDQFIADGIDPGVSPPQFSQHGGLVSSGFALEVTTSESTPSSIYYTTDGSDPRDPQTGTASATAMVYVGGSPVSIGQSQTVQARVLVDDNWSALTEALFTVEFSLRISELMYNPANPSTTEIDAGFSDDDDFEFIELLNIGPYTIDLGGVRFIDGVTFDFSGSAVTSLAAGQRVLVVRDLEAFAVRYGAGFNIAGEYGNNQSSDGQRKLSNGSETIRLEDIGGVPILEFAYDDDWYKPETDGGGYSLVIVDPSADVAQWGEAQGWRPSFEFAGSPGEKDLMLGDLNEDNRVSLTDLAIQQANFGSVGAARSQGDLTSDGVVGRADVVSLLRNFGRAYDRPATSPAAAAASSLVVNTAIESYYRSNGQRPTVTVQARRNTRPPRQAEVAIDAALADWRFEASVRKLRGTSLQAYRNRRSASARQSRAHVEVTVKEVNRS